MANDENLLIQIASYNTNLQNVEGLPQDLVDWLSPTLRVSGFLSNSKQSPDIIAVGFQELLPLHLGLSGRSTQLLQDREKHILASIEANSPTQERYTLLGKVVNVGVALLVFAVDSGVARRACDIQTQWTGSGPCYMGNKGAVGLRFRVPTESGGLGETYTFVCAHLTAHAPKLQRRIDDYRHITGSLLFPPLPNSTSSQPTTIYDTSHMFFFGDLNFRLDIPQTHALHGHKQITELASALDHSKFREEIKEYDQLLIEKRKGTVFQGLREGRFWDFKCTYKYIQGEVNRYSTKRVPSWTDRILYASHLDSPQQPDTTAITNLLYTSVPSYTTSDHKPIIALLHAPRLTAAGEGIPLLQSTGPAITPDPYANLKRYSGRTLDRIIGYIWWLLSLIGAGSSIVGIFNCFVSIGAWRWWTLQSPSGTPV
ncbi:skeletal muscle/kidney enriched inositol 5-phosphatase [Pterulicium gracile]|uniref:Skeletal muscle/kidney enriched inositol 5-phosphatase n=1 Tax=Pterulicium gracile TaxID=1884261 RepID=A0A5C3QZH1_9AGAR|nr:skeletal muscle/kidney enriched inositol 5-phosphatase [Pterula gracilis]